MEPTDPLPEGPRRASSNREWFGRRKQIASREVLPVSTDVEMEMHHAAQGALKPADVIDIPSLRQVVPSEPYVDPTLYTVRQRRRGQNAAYRLTQLIIVAAFILACGGLANSLLGHRLRAMACAGLGCLISLVAVAVVRKSRLAHRLRGYVAAAGVFGAIALAMSLMPPMFHAEPGPLAPEKKTAATSRLSE